MLFTLLPFVGGDKGGTKVFFSVVKHKHGIGFMGKLTKNWLRFSSGCCKVMQLHIPFVKAKGKEVATSSPVQEKEI